MKRFSRILVPVLVLATLLVSACAGASVPVGTSAGAKVQPAPVEFTGVIESITGNQWVINGQPIQVDPALVRDFSFKVGDAVKVKAEVAGDGTVVVQSVESMPADDNSNDNGNVNDNGNDNSNANDNDNSNVNDNDNGNDNSNVNDNDNSNDNSNVNDNGNDNGNDNDNENSNGNENSNDDDSNDDNSNDDNSNDSNDDNSNDSNDDGGGNDNDGGSGGNSNDD